MNYFIVGGNSGIGLALANKLLANGHQVYTASRNPQLNSNTTKAFFLDVTKDVSNLHKELPEVLDGLVYCPGTINLKPFQRLNETDFLTDFQVNVLGAVKIIQQVIPLLKKSQQPSVVLFSTVAVKIGMGFHASIAVAKGAVEGLTISLAAEFAASKIRVNCIAPSLTDTPLAQGLLTNNERKEAAEKRHPLGRVGTAEEMADCASFLLSKSSSWITGQILGIDGGMSSIKNF